MSRLKQIILFIVISSAFWTLGAGLASAQLEYTPLVNLPGTFDTYSDDADEYFVVIFELLIGIAAILAVIMIIFAGFQYVAGASSPSARSDAKDRIFGAVLGLLLALLAWLILNTINPAIVGGDITADATSDSTSCSGGWTTAGGGELCILYREPDQCASIKQTCFATQDDFDGALRCYGLDDNKIVVSSGEYLETDEFPDPHGFIYLENSGTDGDEIADCPGSVGVIESPTEAECNETRTEANSGDWAGIDKVLSNCINLTCNNPTMSITIASGWIDILDPPNCIDSSDWIEAVTPATDPEHCGQIWAQACAYDTDCHEVRQTCTVN